MQPHFKVALSSLALILAACASSPAIGRSEHGKAIDIPVNGAMTKERQAKVTPESALRMLEAGNERFQSGRMVKRDLREMVKVTGHGQFPFASVLSCIDSRSSPEVIFDQGIGDIFSARVAGNFVNKDILGSLEYASKVAGSRLIVVLGHSHCGAIKGVCDNVKLGSLTSLLDKLKPAMNAIPDDGQPRNSKNHEFVEKVAEMNVKMTVKQILDESPILRGLASEGKLKVVGAMLDVETGHVEFLEEPGSHDKMASHDSLAH
ncbi:MAG: carbonic anhydrase family protein [Burkholderiales bacterium]